MKVLRKLIDLLSAIGWVGHALSAAVSAMVWVAAYVKNWDLLTIFLAMLIAYASVAVVYLGFCHYWDRKDALSLGDLCCYLAYRSKWSKGQIVHSPSYAVQVANEIRDAFSQSKIKGVGRRFDVDRPIWLAQKAALQPIPSDWWDGKIIDAWRALNGEASANVVYDDSTQQSGYHDISANRASAELEWPKL